MAWLGRPRETKVEIAVLLPHRINTSKWLNAKQADCNAPWSALHRVRRVPSHFPPPSQRTLQIRTNVYLNYGGDINWPESTISQPSQAEAASSEKKVKHHNVHSALLYNLMQTHHDLTKNYLAHKNSNDKETIIEASTDLLSLFKPSTRRHAATENPTVTTSRFQCSECCTEIRQKKKKKTGRHRVSCAVRRAALPLPPLNVYLMS